MRHIYMHYFCLDLEKFLQHMKHFARRFELKKEDSIWKVLIVSFLHSPDVIVVSTSLF